MANSEIVNKNYLECMETESINVSMYWDVFLDKAGIVRSAAAVFLNFGPYAVSISLHSQLILVSLYLVSLYERNRIWGGNSLVLYNGFGCCSRTILQIIYYIRRFKPRRIMN